MNTALLAALYLCQPSTHPALSKILFDRECVFERTAPVRHASGLMAVPLAFSKSLFVVTDVDDLMSLDRHACCGIVFTDPPAEWVALYLSLHRVRWFVLGDDFREFCKGKTDPVTTFTTL